MSFYSWEVSNGASQRQDSENDSDEKSEPPEHQQLKEPLLTINNGKLHVQVNYYF